MDPQSPKHEISLRVIEINPDCRKGERFISFLLCKQNGIGGVPIFSTVDFTWGQANLALHALKTAINQTVDRAA